MMRKLFAVAIAAFVLLPIASPAAGTLMSNPVQLDLSLSKKDLAVVSPASGAARSTSIRLAVR